MLEECLLKETKGHNLINIKRPWANKILGQHFLNDNKIIEKICLDFKDVAKGILEVGPGPGVLTEKLKKHSLQK